MSKVIAYFKANKLHLVMWTIFLSLVITLYVSQTRAAYKDEFDGSGDMSIAKFEITTNANDKNRAITLSRYNTFENYTFNIKSNSEVDVAYDILITFADVENFPDCVNVILDDTNEPIIIKNRLLFENVGNFFHSESNSKNHTLTFSLNGDKYNLTTEVIEINTITIQIISTQTT